MAANWYVNPKATGLNNGTSWPNAWRSVSSIVWGGAGVKAGHTFFISVGTAGCVYTETLIVGISGTASSRIIIRPGQDPCHNGPVIWDIDDLGDSGSGSTISTNARNYITIDGSMNGARHLVIHNLRSIFNGFAGVGIAAGNARWLVVSNVHNYSVNNALKAWYASEYDIDSKAFQGRGDAVVSLVASIGSSAVNRIRHNIVEIFFNAATPLGGNGPYTKPDGLRSGGNISIYNNTFKATRTYTSSQHPDTIQKVGDDLRIFNNEFINIDASRINRGLYADQTPSEIWNLQQRFPNCGRDKFFAEIHPALRGFGWRQSRLAQQFQGSQQPLLGQRPQLLSDPA